MLRTVLSLSGIALAFALKNCSEYTHGLRMIWVPNCSGAGCLANGVDPECAWCVYDAHVCQGERCQLIMEAREAEKVACPAPLPQNSGNCFISLDAPLSQAPFNQEAIDKMRKYFFRNFNVNKTGGITAAAGAVPALYDCCPGGYTYHWMRDGALSMMALQELVDIDGEGTDSAFAREALTAYVGWVENMQDTSKGDTAHVEPKWNMTTAMPYAEGWCRPQTDGPPLRAQALMRAAEWTTGPSKEKLWPLIKFDLDWVAQNHGSIDLETCDLWEETVDANLLWNRVSMRSSLVKGQIFAEMMHDSERAAIYKNAVQEFVQDPVADHITDMGMLTECPTKSRSDSCAAYNKSIDGAVILSLIHGGWRDGIGVSPSNMAVAHTVEAYNKLFCKIYEVNRADSHNGLPGILIGRYAADEYGGGNPWVLLTSAFASLLYQAAQTGASFTEDELMAWGDALNVPVFNGSAASFVAAGDAVLSRLHAHVTQDDYRLFEQIDKLTGKQYNAEDLTWSYAETLMALHERKLAMIMVHVQTENSFREVHV